MLNLNFASIKNKNMCSDLVAFLSKSNLFQISLRLTRDKVMTSRLIVVKVGTSGITTGEGKLDQMEMQKLAGQIATATKQGDKIVLVTSGAVAAGIAELGIP